MEKKRRKPPKQNKVLLTLRKKVVVQAAIAVQTIVITVAVIFGMSAAWYTNVLQTSGLRFEAAAWGFEGEVFVSDDAIQASPGDSGMIGLTVSNTGTSATDVSVSVTKEQMPQQMQQRLFFYVDSTDIRNGESVDRAYINAADSYTYTVKADRELMLTEERCNDAPLKWQWVYDMLGYYFLGTLTPTETVDDESTQTTPTDPFQIEDYLRPVEYDLDSATFDEDGMLETVDGTTTTEKFLEKLSESDGYEGKAISAVDGMPGYYQVSVDDNGYGIWVYLCNWTQIQEASLYDSALGQAAAQAAAQDGQSESTESTATEPVELGPYIARLTLVGQPAEIEYTKVTSLDQLTTALNEGGNVQLQNDLTLTESLTVDGAVESTLDLNGHTITGIPGSSLMTLTNGADVTVLNGTLEAADKDKTVISVSGSTLTLDQVEITGKGDDAIYISDQTSEKDSVVRLLDSTVNVSGCAVYIRGNGSTNDSRTRVIIENCKLTSGYIAVMGNGTEAYWGTDIQIYNSTLSGYYAAVYQPQGDSVTRLTQSTATGMCGVVVKGGDLYVVDSTVTGNGDKQEPKLEGSGYTDTGDAIYVDCSYEKPIYVSISGESSEIRSTYSFAVQVFVPDGYKDLSTVEITGGQFSSDVSEFVPNGYKYADGTVTETVTEQAGE